LSWRVRRISSKPSASCLAVYVEFSPIAMAMHKVFISYHHSNDQKYKEALRVAFANTTACVARFL